MSDAQLAVCHTRALLLPPLFFDAATVARALILGGALYDYLDSLGAIADL